MKKLLSIVLCIVMLSSALGVIANAAQYSPEILDEDNLALTQNILIDKTFDLGDVNGDGALNSGDSLLLKRRIAGVPDTDIDLSASDFDADGSFSIPDSYCLKLVIAGAQPISAFENGKQLYKFSIGGVTIDNFTIVIPDDAVYDSNLYYATELLYEYIKSATGIALTIERGTASGSNAIYLHNVADDSELGIELGHEGYKYEVKDGSLHIYGTHRGNMYAAYEIIEKYLGFSFNATTSTFSYKQRAVDIEEGTEKILVPAYRFRHTKSTFSSGNRECGYLARRLNGTQSYGYKNEKRSLEYYGDFVGPVFNNIHSYAYYWQMSTGTMPEDDGTMELEARYYAKYQSGEYKDETKWQPCATSASVYNSLFSGLLDTIRMIEARGYPIKYEDGTNCYSFSPNDCKEWCQCTPCRWNKKDYTSTGLYLNLANKAAKDIQQYYPGIKLFTWIYTDEIPTNILPDENLIVVLCGENCANHALGSNECQGNTLFGFNNTHLENVIDTWDDMSKQTGAEIWLWYYPESHFWFMYDLPNIYNIYYDLKWYYEHGITGFFYEGSGGGGYLFEGLKAYLASIMMLDPNITIEEYDAAIKRYLYETYGTGWENIYKFIQMYEEAGDQSGLEDGGTKPYCFIGNHARAYDTTSVVYINEHYEEMRDLLLAAINEYDHDRTTNDDYRIKKLNDLFNCFEILGLGATYLDNYVNGDEAERATYEERYANFLNYVNNTGMRVSSYNEYNSAIPTEVDLSSNPCYHFLPGGSWRASAIALLGK